MLCEYLRTKSESLAQIRTVVAEIEHFSRGLFFIGASCILTSHLAPGRCVEAVQGALVQEVSGRHLSALKRSAWTPSMTVHPHFKHWS